MKNNFNRVVDLGFLYEGGFVNDPDDPGGATNFGITYRTLSAYRGRSCSVSDVKALQKAEAREIYRLNYWNVIRGDELPSGVDEATYDYTINSGPVKAVKDLQIVLGLRPDGHMGAVTLEALKDADAAEVVRKLCARRLAFMRSLRTFKKFGKGWTARVRSCERIAIGMATGTNVTQFTVIGDELLGNAKADPRDVRTFMKTLSGAGQLVAASGISGEAAVEQVKNAADQLSAFQDALPYVKYLCIALTIAGVGLTIFSLIKKAKEA